MPDSDINIIRPVEGSQNIAGTTPTKRRERRKRRQPLARQKSGQGMNEQLKPEEPPEPANENFQDQHSINYRA
ncbi:MAG: hypothetical protein DRP65_10480 [Planctomycetota bacterium]|nr:MAG: hypothetical protein DRP65_10480 [Planctomycetota bacterium]